MRLAGYDDAAINTVVKALVAQTDDEIKPAWEVLGGEEGGIDVEEMRLMIPLLGENLSDEEIEALFAQSDKDSSGHIDFPEFAMMMVSLSPKVQLPHHPLKGGWGVA